MIEVALMDYMGNDLTHVNAARVSFDKQHSELTDKDSKLIKYLIQHEHTSPSRHIQASVRCHAPIFLARQLAKHQVSLSWNEVSRRYVDTEPELFWPRVWRERPDGSVKQGSGQAMSPQHRTWNNNDVLEAYRSCLYAYNQMLERGTAPEQARMVLPQSMMTSWIWTGSLPAFFHVYRLRADPHAQKEAQEFAHKLQDVVEPIAPVTWQAMKENSNV